MVILALVLTAAFSAGYAGQWISFDGSPETVQKTRVLSSDNSSTILEIEIQGMFSEEIMVNGEFFQDLKFHNFATTQQIGAPALPIVAELVAIPGNYNVRVSIVSEETITLGGYHIAPFQTPTTDDQPAAAFDYDQTVYAANANFPASRTELGEIGIMRGLRVVPVRVVPFSYNPVTKELTVSTKMVVKVEYFGVSNQAPLTDQLSEVNPRVAKWMRDAVVNFEQMNLQVVDETDEFLVKYLIICTPEAVPIIQPLVDLRNSQGYGVEVRLRETGFSTADQFRDYIHSLYVSDGLEYVLMVGDWCPTTGHMIMPMYQWQDTWSDSWYTMIDPWPNTGNDYLADIAIGRIVYDNIAELQLQMDKTMGYLTEPSTANNWAEHTLLVAHQEQYPLKYTQCKEQIRTFAYAIQTPIFGQAYGGAGATNTDVINYLNSSGSGILNYRGHGSTTEWWQWGPSGSFTAAHIAQLTNVDKLFVHFDVCCDNMDFPGYNGNCLAESFMKSPVAAVAINSAIIPSYTIPNHDYDKEFYKAIYNLGINNIGYASNYANITVYTVHGTIGQSNIRTYLWLGDSAIDPWTLTPAALTVTHNPVVFIGATSLDVTVMMSGSPVEEAMVCVNNPEVYNVGWTNAAGFISLIFEGPVTQAGEMQLTVSCHNGLTYQVDLPVIPATGPYVTCAGVELDDSPGNNNGMLNPGETANLSLSMTNVGIATADNVIVTISTTDTYTTILDPQAAYGNIMVGDTLTVTGGFQIQMAANTPYNHTPLFTVNAVSGASTYQSSFILQVYPDLQVTLTPAVPGFTIPAAGGSFQYTIQMNNLSAVTASYTVWIDAVLPGGTVYGPIQQRAMSLAGSGTFSRTLTQVIPAGAPAGAYEYRAFMGYYPNTVISEDSFNFTKLGTDGSGSSYNWELSGWDNASAISSAPVPSAYFLAQNHPNPFNPETTISFGLPEAGLVTLEIYNITGQKVAVLADGYMNAGVHDVTWNASMLSTGIYFYKLQAGNFSEMKKMAFVK